ncbi:glucose-1-phosphate thymidylyltransferase [Natronomonas sp. EA1]|uniref:glucose-1-phosphate thymidylyltransferase n=1 Tax=Natronomonas sp. EA1 TaxID=3421655 RepID=UPI003EBE5503
MKGVLLAGGTGTRLRPITHTGPKQLVPVANKPVIQYAIEDLKQAEIQEIAVVLGNKGQEDVQQFLGDGSWLGVDITYIVQGEPLGIAHAVGCAKEFVEDDPFVVYLGDNLLRDGVVDLVESFQAGDFTAGIALQSVDDPSRFGVAELDEDGQVRRLVEKPDEFVSDLALVGIYVFSPSIFEIIEGLTPSDRGELEITEAIDVLVDSGEKVDSHVVKGWWKDTGKPEDILEANRLVLESHTGSQNGVIEEDAEVTGSVELHKTAEVRDGAVVRGPVSINRGTVIRAGAYVGPYTSIGPNTVVEGVHVENSVIVGDSTITTDGRIVDSLIGRGAAVTSARDLLPEGRRLVVGENSKLKL